MEQIIDYQLLKARTQLIIDKFAVMDFVQEVLARCHSKGMSSVPESHIVPLIQQTETPLNGQGMKGYQCSQCKLTYF